MNEHALDATSASAIRAAHLPPSGAAPVGGERRARAMYGRRGPGRWALRHPVASLLAVVAFGYALGAMLRISVLPDPSCTEPAPS